MSAFKEGCSCRVWALDGWAGEAESKLVNSKIETLGFQLFEKGVRGLAERFQELKSCRVALDSEVPCKIYGFYEGPGDAIPMHMWLVDGDYIYDTVPGDPLNRKLAAGNLLHPPGGDDLPYAENLVASFDWCLSVRHITILKAVENNCNQDEFEVPD